MAETKKGIPLMSLSDIADITQVNKGFNKIDELIEMHENTKITDSNGVHGLRYNPEEEELEYLNESNEWESLTGVGGGATANISPVKNIKIIKGNGNLKIIWQDPDDLTWAGTKLVYKIGSYPQNPKDGTLVVDNKVKNQYKDEGISVNALTNGTKYYFMFFPYDSKNKFSFDVANRVIGIPHAYREMTVKIDRNNANPETCCTYHDDAVGMTPGSEEWDEFFGYYPCLVQGAKEVGKLRKDDYNKFEDGSTADITSGRSGDVMVCFPRLFWRVKQDENYTYISLTDNPSPDSDFCDLSHFLNNKHFKKIYIGAYLISGSNSSISNAVIKKNLTLNTLEQQLTNKGTTYSNITFYAWTYLQILFLLKYKTLKTIMITGTPLANTELDSKTGLLNSNGMNYMNDSVSGKKRVKVFGLEDFVGEAHCLISNLEVTNKTLKIATEKGNYKEIIRNFIPSDTTGVSGYPLDIIGKNETGFISNIFGGSVSTFYSAWQGWVNNNTALITDAGGNGNSLFSISLLYQRDKPTTNYVSARIMCFDGEVV